MTFAKLAVSRKAIKKHFTLTKFNIFVIYCIFLQNYISLSLISLYRTTQPMTMDCVTVRKNIGKIIRSLTVVR